VAAVNHWLYYRYCSVAEGLARPAGGNYFDSDFRQKTHSLRQPAEVEEVRSKVSGLGLE
jgi:hypothetical protein